MKSLKEQLNINESKTEIKYSFSLLAVKDNDGLPITVHMSVEPQYRKEFEKWLEDTMMDNEFGHGGSADGEWEY